MTNPIFDAKQKRILDLFRESRFLTTREIAEHLGVTPFNRENGITPRTAATS